MFSAVKNAVSKMLMKSGIALTSARNLKGLNDLKEEFLRYEIFIQKLLNLKMSAEEIFQVHSLYSRSKSQLFQDLFVLSYLGFKKDGYFVEIGAANGKDISNTWLLEKDFGWHGILVEPARVWQESLRENRNATIVNKAVWRDSNNELDFTEARFAELSGLSLYLQKDTRAKKNYKVATITVNELLETLHAPSVIDYLSVDVEGSELEILESIDFEKYTFRFISVEHNYRADRISMRQLLESHGYRQCLGSISEFDDWYVRDF
jgi:FkbM family methyltransferase